MTYRTEKELMEAGGECRNCSPIGPWLYELPDGTFWKVHSQALGDLAELNSTEIAEIMGDV